MKQTYRKRLAEQRKLGWGPQAPWRARILAAADARIASGMHPHQALGYCYNHATCRDDRECTICGIVHFFDSPRVADAE
jgi:hypothetical protein